LTGREELGDFNDIYDLRRENIRMRLKYIG